MADAAWPSGLDMTKEEYDRKISEGWKPGPSCPKCKKQHLRRKLKRCDSFEVEDEGCKYKGPLPP